MKTFENELWNCPSCGPPETPKTIKNWKCPTCNDPLWIMVNVAGMPLVLERVMAKTLEKGDSILLDGADFASKITDVVLAADKIRLVIDDQLKLDVNSEMFFNSIIGLWKDSDED